MTNPTSCGEPPALSKGLPRHNVEVQPPLIVLVGPTASGKSGLAVDVAVGLQQSGHPAEIVNSDSMLVYRGMDIGTAKPTMAERRGVVHHLVDVADISETLTVAWFQQQARAVIADCRSRGVVPVLVGGSALYTRAIVDEFEFPGTDAAVRRHWEDQLARRGAADLHRELAQRAPEVARDILPGNRRRVVRAHEVLDLTGDFRPTLPAWTHALEDVRQLGLQVPREELDRRIEARVEQMWADGLVDEVRRLRPALEHGRTASMALGYRQVLAFLAGECTEDEARRATITGTRRFARKQLGWYQRDARITWLAHDDPAAADAVIAAACR